MNITAIHDRRRRLLCILGLALLVAAPVAARQRTFATPQEAAAALAAALKANDEPALLGIFGEPLLKRVYRWERGNAQHEVGHLDRLARIEAALLTIPGLHLTGSGYRGVGIPDCVADGRATAKKVCTWLASPVPA